MPMRRGGQNAVRPEDEGQFLGNQTSPDLPSPCQVWAAQAALTIHSSRNEEAHKHSKDSFPAKAIRRFMPKQNLVSQLRL